MGLSCWDWIFPDPFYTLRLSCRDIVSLDGDHLYQPLKDYNCAPTSSAGEAMGKSCSEASELVGWYANGAKWNKEDSFNTERLNVLWIRWKQNDKHLQSFSDGIGTIQVDCKQ